MERNRRETASDWRGPKREVDLQWLGADCIKENLTRKSLSFLWIYYFIEALEETVE